MVGGKTLPQIPAGSRELYGSKCTFGLSCCRGEFPEVVEAWIAPVSEYHE